MTPERAEAIEPLVARFVEVEKLTRELFGVGIACDISVLTPEEVAARVARNGPFIREILENGRVVYERA